MSDAIAMIEGAMRADAEALRVIGQNIANAEVPAYRRQIASTSVRFDDLVARGEGTAEHAPAREPMHAVFDSRAGTLRSSGEPLHVALEGTGFLLLMSAQDALLTRRGDLSVSADGLLMSASGHAVMGDGGPIHVGAAIPQIDTAGNVRVGGEIVDRLRIVQIADESQLRYVGSGTYASAPSAVYDGEGQTIVRQGFLEGSNVAPVGEMVQMMETLRHFEAAQRFVRSYDELLGKAISELGKVG